MKDRKKEKLQKPPACSFGVREGYLLICCEGELNAETITRTSDEIHADVPLQAMNDLWDLRACTANTLSYGQIQNIFEHIRARGFRHHNRSAILVSREHHFGLSRIYQALSDNERKDHLSIGIFRDLESAVEWLGKDSELK